MRTTGSDGETDYVEGKVDYVVYENGKPYLSINESLYSLDDLDTVVDTEYKSAYETAQSFVSALSKLPSVANITISGEGSAIDALTESYEAMDDYTKGFVSADNVSKYKQYAAKLTELRAAALTED